MTSIGWVPILIEIGSGSFLANAFSAKRRKLLGVTMSMPVSAFSFTR